MNKRKLATLVAAVAFAVGISAALMTAEARRPRPDPPPCACAPTVGPCVLAECGAFDCVYVCPFP